MLAYIERKRPDYGRVEALLQASEDRSHWTNFGPVAAALEAELHQMLDLSPSHSVVACSSGSMSLFGIVNLLRYRAGRPLRWVVPSFTFRCHDQGPLEHSMVLDCDFTGQLSVGALQSLDPDEFDGVIVTHPLSVARDTLDFEAWGAGARQADRLRRCKLSRFSHRGAPGGGSRRCGLHQPASHQASWLWRRRCSDHPERVRRSVSLDHQFWSARGSRHRATLDEWQNGGCRGGLHPGSHRASRRNSLRSSRTILEDRSDRRFPRPRHPRPKDQNPPTFQPAFRS